MAEDHSKVKGCVYQARNKINGKCYVGKSVDGLEHRLEALKRRWADPEMRAKLVAGRKGRKHRPRSEEQRAKLKALRSTPEYRAQQSARVKLSWEKRRATGNVGVVSYHQKTLF